MYLTEDTKKDNNKRYTQDSSTLSPLSYLAGEKMEDDSFDNKRLTSIDVISVDKQWRLTLTKKAKKIIPLGPGDNITIYQDIYNKNIILKVQKQGQEKKEIDNWTLTIKRGGEDFSNKKNTGFLNNTKNQVASSFSSLSSPTIPTSDKYISHYNQDTLYSTPILLVDDNSDLLFYYNRILKDEGYRKIKSFSDSKEMLTYLLELKPNSLRYKIVILDIRMPDVNGIQLYQILKILNPSIKPIFITALDAVAELTSIFPDIKHKDIIRKPIDRKEFIQTINDQVSILLGGSIILSVSLLTRIIQDYLLPV